MRTSATPIHCWRWRTLPRSRRDSTAVHTVAPGWQFATFLTHTNTFSSLNNITMNFEVWGKGQLRGGGNRNIYISKFSEGKSKKKERDVTHQLPRTLMRDERAIQSGFMLSWRQLEYSTTYKPPPTLSWPYMTRAWGGHMASSIWLGKMQQIPGIPINCCLIHYRGGNRPMH